MVRLPLTLALMNSRVIRFAAVAALGLLTPVWWTWAASTLTYEFFVVAGSPERPSQVTAWSSLLLPCLLLGLATGLAVSYRAPRPLSWWSIFAIAWLAGTALLGSLSVLEDVAASPGTWVFALGTLILPMYSHFQRRERTGREG